MQSIEELTFTGLELVFLIIGIVMIASILLSEFNPNEQIAIADTQKLAGIMNQLCVGNAPGSSVPISFNLPQTTPPGSSVFSVLPTFLMKTSGDPSFVVYYESFPPGEGIGWEVFNDFDNRLYLRLPDNFGNKPVDEVKKYVEDKRAAFISANPGVNLEGIVVTNIVLNAQYNGIFVEKLDAAKPLATGQGGASGGAGATGSAEGPAQTTSIEKDASKALFGFGQWDSAKNTGNPADLNQEDYFKFSNYLGLPTVSKTLIKYETCAPNSLCLKTKSGVYRFPLDKCNNIKTVQLVYDARQRKWVYGSVVAAVAATVTGGAGVAVYTGGIGSLADIAAGTSLFINTIGTGAFEAGSGILPRLLSVAWKHPLVSIGSADIVAEKAGAWLLGAFLSYKTGDFAVTSPCSLQDAKITYGTCDNACKGYVSYPIYRIDKDGNVINTNHVHYLCTDKIADSDKNEIASSEALNDNDKCIQVQVSDKPDGFCWTSDPSEKGWISSDTQLFASSLSLSPVWDALGYDKNTDTIFLRKSSADQFTGWYDEWKRTVYWGWPGGGNALVAGVAQTIQSSR